MRAALVTAVLVGVAAAPPVADASRVHLMVVFRDGSARVAHPATDQTTVKVGARRCAVAGATPLAALVRSGIGPLSLRDFGACSKRPADGGGLFVSAIGPDRNRGSDGWVYKAGNALGTAGAADPAGPFGRGRLKAGARLTWFWCHVTAADRGCTQTLAVTQASTPAGTLAVNVRRYDDRGKPAAAPGALVHAGSSTATADQSGRATFVRPAGRMSVWAEQPGRIRSFTVGMTVR